MNHVSFVAKVLNITRGTTNISYTVEDGTGSIDVRSWIDSQEDDTGMGDGIAQDTLVRVLGGIKLFSGKRFINALHVHPVVDMNEQQFHLLEAIHCHLLNTRGPPVRDLPYEQVSVCSGPAIVHRQTLEVMHRNAYNLQTMVLQIMLNPSKSACLSVCVLNNAQWMTAAQITIKQINGPISQIQSNAKSWATLRG